MIEKILTWHALRLFGDTPHVPSSKIEGTITASQLRAISAQAGLVASVDGSLGALVNLWAHDERLHPSCAHHTRWHRSN
jgi:hypothetical protein